MLEGTDSIKDEMILQKTLSLHKSKPGMAKNNKAWKRAMPYCKSSMRFQLMIFHQSSPHVYRHDDSSRRCTVATVQDEENPSSSQPAASCCVASESMEAHRDSWQEYVLTGESVLSRKQPRRKSGV